jgi:electron transport complex protein RnfB
MTSLHTSLAVAVIVSAGAAIALAALVLRRATTPLVERIDALLPQSQCMQCGYAGCRPYAQAIAQASAAINRCPPGGDRVIRKLARITGKPYVPLEATCGPHKSRQLALIDEQRCIGCTLCIQACPVDAIVGAPKLMHTVIGSECTGCELCLPPCPVDCITLEPAQWSTLEALLGAQRRAAALARKRFTSRAGRLERNIREHTQRLATRAAAKRMTAEPTMDAAAQRKQLIVEAAIERARVKLAASTSGGNR